MSVFNEFVKFGIQVFTVDIVVERILAQVVIVGPIVGQLLYVLGGGLVPFILRGVHLQYAYGPVAESLEGQLVSFSGYGVRFLGDIALLLLGVELHYADVDVLPALHLLLLYLCQYDFLLGPGHLHLALSESPVQYGDAECQTYYLLVHGIAVR